MKPNIGSGDRGETSISAGRRVAKDSAVVEALGAIDEASAAIGLARSFARSRHVKDLLNGCQTALQKCAAEVAAAGGRPRDRFRLRRRRRRARVRDRARRPRRAPPVRVRQPWRHSTGSGPSSRPRRSAPRRAPRLRPRARGAPAARRHRQVPQSPLRPPLRPRLRGGVVLTPCRRKASGDLSASPSTPVRRLRRS